MAYTALLTSEANTIDGDTYRIRVFYDSTLVTPVSVPFVATLAKPTFRLQYSPDSNDITGGIIGSRFQFFIINDTSTSNIDRFLSDVLAFQQSSAWTVLVEKDTGSGYVDYWRGILLQDQIRQEDSGINSVITLTAVDGLAFLKSQDYNLANTQNTTEPLYTPVNDVIRKALQLGINTDFWGASDTYLSTSVDWWEDSQTYTPLNDPLDTQVFDTRAFVQINDRPDGFVNLSFQSAYQVLEQFCRVYFCRLYMAGGYYHFEQIPLRKNTNVKEVFYDKSGTKLSSALNNKTEIIGTTLNSSRLAGNTFTQFPALKRVEATLKPYLSQYENELTLPTVIYSDSVFKNFGYVDKDLGNILGFGPLGQRLNINVDFNITADWSWVSSDRVLSYGTNIAAYVGIRPQVRCKIELNDINSTTNYYWTGTSWSTSSTTFTIEGAEKLDALGSSITSGNLRYRPNDNITQIVQTNNLPVTGTVTITLDQYRLQYLNALSGSNQWDTFSTASLLNPGNLGGSGVQLTFGTKYDRGDTVRVFTLENSDSKIADNESYVYPDITISDGTLQTGSIMILTGSVQAATDWNVGNGSENTALGALLVRQRLEMQREILNQYSGVVKMSKGYDIALNFDSQLWIPYEYELNGYNNDVNGEWYALAQTSETVNAPSEVSPALSFLASPNQGFFKYGGPFRVGGRTTAQNLYPGYVIDESEDISYVTLPHNINKGQRNNYRTIAASNGGSASIDETETVLFFTWTGVNGSFDLEIPDSSNMDGARLEIILNDDYNGNQTITITPAGGQIQAASAIEVNTQGRTLLRGIDGNWW